MSEYRIFDSHCDTAYELWKRKERVDRTSCCVDLAQMQQFSSCAQFFAFCSYSGLNENYSSEQLLLEPYRYFMKQLQSHAQEMKLCCSYDDYLMSCSERKIAAFLSLEGAEGIKCDPGRLPTLRDMGFSMINLTWNMNNALAGCAVHDGGGLTRQGKEFVQQAQRVGLIIDVSHISDKAFWDIMDITQGPIVASHSNSRALCAHKRNLTDEQFVAICQTGGYVGINLYHDFLTDRAEATFEDVFMHIDHFLQLDGQGHIALGGDLDGCDKLPNGFDGFEKYDHLASFLRQKGLSEKMVQDIYSNTIEEVIKLCVM